MDALWQSTALTIWRWRWSSCLILDSYRHVVVARVVDIDRLNGPGRSHTYTTMRVLRHRGLLHFTLRLHRGIVVSLVTPHCIYPTRLQLIFRRSDQLDVGWFLIEGYRLWWELVDLFSFAHCIKASVADHITQLICLLAALLTLLIWAFCCNMAIILKLTYGFSSLIVRFLRRLHAIISLKFVLEQSVEVIISFSHASNSILSFVPIWLFVDTSFTHDIRTISETLTHKVRLIIRDYLLNHFR